jgi:hypothetical protein
MKNEPNKALEPIPAIVTGLAQLAPRRSPAWLIFDVRQNSMKKLLSSIFCVVCLLGTGCSNDSDSLAGESLYFRQQIELHEEYESGDPVRAKEALNKKIEATKLASVEEISDFWKLQSQAFDLTRLAMVEEYLGRKENAELLKKEALRNINEWLVLGKREPIGYEKLQQSVIGADQDFKAPWHP